MSELNPLGQEVFDQTPVSYPLHFDRPTPLHVRIRNMILQASLEAHDNDMETIEEANDFSMPDIDDENWNSPYEEQDYVNAELETLSKRSNQSEDEFSKTEPQVKSEKSSED